jgi:ACT domain-containing protein
MSSHSQELNEETVVQDMIGLTDEIQVERIANQLSEVLNAYSPLKDEDTDILYIIDDRPLPDINPYTVYLKIMSIKKKTSTVLGDIPMKVIKFCAEELSFPLSDIYL